MDDRLPYHPIQRVDRGRELLFCYRGRPIKGLAGDTVATALFANGLRIFSRSLKYHRPRGLYSLDGLSANCLMSVDKEPNVRVCAEPLYAGMMVEPQNVAGSARWDLMSLLQWVRFAVPAGFRYKAFHKPAWIWPIAQKVLRRRAGLGKIDPDMPAGVYDSKYLSAEVCVIGGGPAGMAAALAAAKAGVRVVLMETRQWLGGSLCYRLVPVHGRLPAYLHGAEVADQVLGRENIRVLLSTSATGICQSNHVTAVQRGGPCDYFRARCYEVRAASVVVATGATERPLIFQNNDCPGIMQADCAQQLVHLYGLRPGRQAVVCGAHDRFLEIACELAEAGVAVAGVADARADGFGAEAIDRLYGAGIPFYPGCAVVKARQLKTLRGAVLRPLGGGRKISLSCDLLVASAGETPLYQLLQAAGAKMAYDARTSQFLPSALPPAVHAAGRVLALDGFEAIELQGKVAGLSALQNLGLDVKVELAAACAELDEYDRPKVSRIGVDSAGRGGKRFVSFDEDVTVTQIEEAMSEGYDRLELVKRYTGAGTGPSQGYLTSYNLAAVVAKKRGSDLAESVPAPARPPVMPASLAALGGRHRKRVKLTPLHDRQAALGARFQLVGEWLCARHFGDDETALEEVANVRNNVGFIDISTLGKFRVHGPDALKLLQRVYIRDMSKVAEGRLTYAIMCNEEGIVIDDGLVTRLKENDYYLTTSAARAPHTWEWLKAHREDENWRAQVVNLTDARAALNLVGPRAREVLRELTDENVGDEMLPFMGVRTVTLCNHMEVCVCRVGFTGELCYEIHVPSSFGPALHDAILEAGRPFGIRPFGTEAQTVLRLEKGRPAIAVDTDSCTTPHEIGLARFWDRTKRDATTVGAHALRFAQEQTHRHILIGFAMEDPGQTPCDGSIVVENGIVRGRISTCRFTPTLNASIGMALVDPELAVDAGILEVYTDQKLDKGRLGERRTTMARIVPLPFYDPEGKRARC